MRARIKKQLLRHTPTMAGVLLLASYDMVASHEVITKDHSSIECDNLEVQFQADEHYACYLSEFEKFKQTNKDLHVPLTHLDVAARMGNVEAQVRIGFMLCTGTLLPENRESGEFWLLAASEKGHLEAQKLLASQFIRREQESTDEKETDVFRHNAIHWLRKAADKGDLPAMSLLGKVLVQKDDDRAEGLELLEKAAQGGNESARETLAFIDSYLNDKSSEDDSAPDALE